MAECRTVKNGIKKYVKNMKKIFIRADGNRKLGLGHIMRCSSIAEALQKKGVLPCFIVADADSAEIVQRRSFPVYLLNSKWNNLEVEIDDMVKMVQKEQIKLLLIDSYYVSERYFSVLRKYTEIVYLTGMNDFLYPVDVLINYHIYAEYLGYQKQYGDGTKLVLGSDYVPLREEFFPLPLYKAGEKTILITTGGTDPYQIIPDLLKMLRRTECGQRKYYIIVGAYFMQDEIELLRQIQQKVPGLFLCRNVENMAEIMAKCSIAISAAGTTLYELCACGIPTVTFTFADNQQLSAETFSKKGIMESAGDIRGNKEGALIRIVQGVIKYAREPAVCQQKSNIMRKYIDGKGSERLAQILIDELAEK